MSNTPIKFKLKMIVVTILASFIVSDLHAQRAAIQEVVVTARKKSEDIQTIPLAVNALGAGIIAEKGISEIADVASLTSGLNFEVGALPSDTKATIRGLTSDRGRPNVAILVDFVDVTSENLAIAGGGITANMRLMDLERVEVVKGPQSVLYGRSAFSGAINYITKRPTKEFESDIEVGADEHNTYESKFMASGSLTDTLSARINLATWETDGWYENPNTGGNLGDGEMSGIAGALLWQPSDSFSSYFRTEYSDEEYGPRAQVFKSVVNNTPDFSIDPLGQGQLNSGAVVKPYRFTSPINCSTTALYQGLLGGQKCLPVLDGRLSAKESQIDLSADPRTGDDFAGTEVDNLRSHLELSWDVNDITIQSITGYTKNNSRIQEDFDLTDFDLVTDFGQQLFGGAFGPIPYTQSGLSAASDQRTDVEQLSQELRFTGSVNKIDWVVSALYWTENMTVSLADQWWLRAGAEPSTVAAVNSFFLPGFPATAVPASGPGTLPGDDIDRGTDHSSIAGSLAFPIRDDVRLTLEGRWLHEAIEYDGTSQDRGFCTAFGVIDASANALYCNHTPTQNRADDDAFVPRTTIDWQASDNLFFYANIAKGFKPGGVQTVDANTNVATGNYDPEELWAYEAGAKSDWLDGTVQLNGAVFYYDYTNQQVPLTITDAVTGLPNAGTVNAGATEVQGFEFDVVWNISEGLSYTVGYTFSDATYKDFNLRDSFEKAGLDPAGIGTLDLARSGNADGDYSGNQLQMAARHSVVTALRYEFSVNGMGDVFTEIGGNYQSKRYINNDEGAYLPSYWLWNLSAGLDTESWKFVAYIDNVLDDDKIKSATGNVNYGYFPDFGSTPDAVNMVLPQPRTVGARFTYRF